LLVLLAAAPGRLGADGQRIEGDRLVDEDYRFALALPAPRWKLLLEADARKLAPDAIAGCSSLDGTHAMIIFEMAPEGDLEAFARLIEGNLDLEERVSEGFEKVEYLGRPAIRFRNRGKFNDIHLGMEHNIFRHQGFTVQWIAWGLPEKMAKDGASLEAARGALTLLEGEVKGRPENRRTPDRTGIGWRVKDGRYENAAMGFALRPPGNWRLLVGDELTQTNADAAIGLESAAPDLYLILIPERAAGVDRAEFTKFIRATVAEELQPSEVSFDLELDRHDVTLRVHRGVGPPPIWLAHGVFFDGDMCFQLQAWCLEGLEAKARERLGEAVKGFTFLGEEERERLTGQLAAGPDTENQVGLDFALRQGRYLDFKAGFTWTKPPGFWKVSAGQAARASNAEAMLDIEELSRSLNALVIVESAEGHDADSYHALVTRRVFDDAEGAPARPAKTLTLGCADGRSTIGDRSTPIPLTYRVVTAVHGARLFQLLIWGTPGNMAASPAAIEAAVNAFKVHELPFPASRKASDSYRDERLGFELRSPGKDWKFRQERLPVEAASVLVHWDGGSGRMLQAVAVYPASEGFDEAAAVDLVSRSVVSRLPRVKESTPEERINTLAGLPASHLKWSSESTDLDALIVRRDRTFLALIVASRAGDPRLEDMARCFSLLD
jgi:hypothetical protein